MSYLDGVAFGGDQISGINEYDLSASYECSMDRQKYKNKKDMADLQKAISDIAEKQQNLETKEVVPSVISNVPNVPQIVESMSNAVKSEDRYLLILLVFVCVICVIQYHQLQNISTQLQILTYRAGPVS